MLVCALAGRKNIMKAYKEAVDNKYRFFSFGDAMFINNVNYKNRYHSILRYYDKENYKTYDYFKIDKGNNNIILSAPHAFVHSRNGKIKSNENNTNKIVKIVSMLTGCHVIYTYKDTDCDPNHDDDSLYKKELSKYIKENNIKYLIDVHGLNVKTDCPLEIGTNNYKNIDEKIVNIIKEIFNKYYDGEIIVDEKFKAKSNKRITNYISEYNDIETIQLEINRKYRRLEHRSITFSKTIEALLEIIKKLEEI